MDADGATFGGRGDAKKRRAPAAAAAVAASATGSNASDLAPQLPLVSRKKPRRRDVATGRESEFLSVEVGMRELRKRLAASDDGASAVSNATRRSSGRSNKDDANRGGERGVEPELAPSPAARRGRPATMRPAPAKRAAKSATATATRSRRVTPQKDAAKKTPTAAKSAEKPTLAEVRVQVQQEQQARVATRVQELKSGKTDAGTGADDTMTSNASIATPAAASAGVMAHTASSAGPTVGAEVPPHPIADKQERLAATVNAPGSNEIPSVFQTPSSDVKRVPGPPPAMQAAPSEPAATNEFIGDDMDEDLIFLLALEEVEEKLTMPAKATASAAPAAVTCSAASNVDQWSLSQTAAAFKQEVEQPAMQSVSQEDTSQHQLPQPEPAVIQHPPSIMYPDDVLREFERLKHENEELRKSNERLQAVALTRTSPSPSGSSPATAPLTEDEMPRASAPSVADPVDEESVQQTRRVLNLGGVAASEEEGDNAGGRASPIAADQHERRQALLSTSPPISRSNHPRPARQILEPPVAERSTSARDDSRVSVLDLSPAPMPVRPSKETQATSSSPKKSTAVTSDEQEHALEEEEARAPTTPGHHESDGDAPPSSGSPARDGDSGGDEHVHSDDEEEEHRDSQTVTIDCGNYGEYKQGQHEHEGEDEEDDEDDEDDEEDGHDKSDGAVVGEEGMEDEGVHDSPTTKVVDLSSSLQQREDGAGYTSGQPTSIDLVDDADEDEDAVTSLPSEPASSVEVDEEEESFVSAKRGSRPVLIESSSSESSDASSDSEPDDVDASPTSNGSGGAKNALEAALQAAASITSAKKKFAPHAPAPRPAANVPTPTNRLSVSATSISATNLKTNQKRPAPTSSAATLGSSQAGAKKRARSDSTSFTSNVTAISKPKGSASTAATIRSTLLWPALDDFYDFLLNLSPGHVGGGGGQRNDWSASSSSSLRRFAGRKLPTRYESVEQYCTTQLDAITEELLASIGNNASNRGGGGKPFYLTSVSQCNPNLNANAQIFSESGFTGAARNASDFILTFRPLPRPRGQHDSAKRANGGSLDLMSGDLISLRSPQWKSFELFVYGVVLCNSIMGDIGGSSNGSAGGDGSDQVCVLVRVQKREWCAHEESAASDEKALLANFSVVTELCLSNQRAAKWSWSIQYVHNTTTSAREYQAIKSMAFFSPELRKTLLDGVLPTATGEKEGEDYRAEDVLSPELKKRLERQYNASQMRAIVGCLGNDKTVMIQGPPGTGKTKTVLGLLSALLDGAGLSTLRKGTARIRVGASLQGGGRKHSGNGPRNNSVRVLVAAPSNAAVDELVVRVVSEGLVDGSTDQSYRPRMVRVGRPESVNTNSGSHPHIASEREASAAKKTRGKVRKYAAEVEDILLETQVARQKASFGSARAARQAIVRGAQIVFCTLSGAGSVALCDFAHEFDALVIDEAAQAVEASALIPFKFRPHRAILVGDHCQLPATVLSKRLVAIGYDRSLFQRLVENDSRVHLLTRQYRMHPDIARFPSAYFYGDKLVQDAQLACSTARAFHEHELFRPFAFIDVAGGEQSQVSGSTSLRNLSEVELVVLLVRALLRQFPELEWKKTIGVIAPYKQQIFELGARMARLERELDMRLGIEVNTVDGFQGREKDIIIYSCVRTSAGGRRGGKKQQKRNKTKGGDSAADAFWADERRMNVAITRARSSLWILGNSRLLEQSAAWRSLIKNARGRHSYFSDDRAKKLLLPSAGDDGDGDTEED